VITGVAAGLSVESHVIWTLRYGYNASMSEALTFQKNVLTVFRLLTCSTDKEHVNVIVFPFVLPYFLHTGNRFSASKDLF